MTDKELLSAISTMLDEKFAPLQNDVAILKDSVLKLQCDVSKLQCDVSKLQCDMAVLQDNVTKLNGDVAELKSDYVDLRDDNKSIRQEMRDGFSKLELIIENDLRPNINLLVENYLPSANRYEEQMKELETMKVDVTLLKKVVTEHSEILQNIS